MLRLLPNIPPASFESVLPLIINLADVTQVQNKIKWLKTQQEQYGRARGNNSMSASNSDASPTPSDPTVAMTTDAKASVLAVAAVVVADLELARPESALLPSEVHYDRAQTSFSVQAEASCGAVVEQSSSLSLHSTLPANGTPPPSHRNFQEASTVTGGSKDSITSAVTQRRPASSAAEFEASVPAGQFSVGSCVHVCDSCILI